MQVETSKMENKWHDITYWGIRASIGTIFIVHSLKKFDPSWQGWLVDMAGLPAELQLPIALAELIGGIFLITGVLTRITGVIFSAILLGAIFHIRWENGFFISEGGWEWDLVMLAASEELFPDVILIDGGLGQLHAALEVFDHMSIQPPRVISIAKKEELVYVREKSQPLRLSRNDPTLQLLQYIRDESHRFAQHYHHILRKKQLFND